MTITGGSSAPTSAQVISALGFTPISVANINFMTSTVALSLSSVVRFNAPILDATNTFTNATEGNSNIPYTKAFTVVRVRSRITAALTGGNTVLSFRDATGNQTIGSLTSTTGATGLFDSGAISTAVAAASSIGFKLDGSAASAGTLSSYIIAECTTTT